MKIGKSLENVLKWGGRIGACVGAYLILNNAEAQGQTNFNITNPTDYNPEISVKYDFNKDGVKEIVSAVDTARVGSYGYKLSADFSGKEKELDKTTGQIYGIVILDNKIIYFVNNSGPKEKSKNMMDRNWSFEQREIEYDPLGKFSKPRITGTSTNSPYLGEIDFK